MSILDYVDELIFADGNSTDGTLEIIDLIKRKFDKGDKIKLFLDKDCKDLQQDYVSLFDWTLKQVKSDYAWFIHPDMICINPETIRPAIEKGGMRYHVGLVSIAGDKRELKFLEGRDGSWATIYRNAYGLHYYGNYGTAEEDCYFQDLTGDVHVFWKIQKRLPYQILDSGIKLIHYCDCKPYKRRYERMLKCLKNLYPERPEMDLEIEAAKHPRVNLKDGTYINKVFKFAPNDYIPEVFKRYAEHFEPLRKPCEF
jgi:glycosyltransferase involved in cell wall biosynthesis